MKKKMKMEKITNTSSITLNFMLFMCIVNIRSPQYGKHRIKTEITITSSYECNRSSIFGKNITEFESIRCLMNSEYSANK